MKKLFLLFWILFSMLVLTAQTDSLQVETGQESSIPHTKVNPVSDLHIFPNPAVDHINLEFKIAVAKPLTIAIVNQIGQIIRIEDLEIIIPGSKKKKIDISEIPPGIYFLNIKSDPTKQLTRRIVIK